MKKYILLILTLISVCITIISYRYENSHAIPPNIKKPIINIKSSKFGEIKNIVWIKGSISHKNSLLILSNKTKDNIKYSNLYYLDIKTGKSTLINTFKSHKNLDNVILFDDSFSSNDIVTAYSDGIIRTHVFLNENASPAFENIKIEIDNFKDANSMDFKGNLFYSKPRDNLIYMKSYYRNSTFHMFNNKPNSRNYYKKPYYLVNSDLMGNTLVYTSLNKNRLDLYGMDNNGGVLLKLLKNVIYAKGVHHYGFIAMNTSNNNLNIFKFKDIKFSDNPSTLIDTIPYNLDIFNSIPSIDEYNSNNEYTVVYSSFYKNHKGNIKICTNNKKPKIIVKNKYIFGPVRISYKELNNKDTLMILYFYRENDKYKINICDVNGKLIKDITNLII